MINDIALNVKSEAVDVVGLKPILGQIERLTISSYYHIKGDFYETVLKFCSRLKYLSIEIVDQRDTLIGSSNEWMLQKYPNIETLFLKVTYPETTPRYTKLKTLFRENPNIRTFSITSNLSVTT